MFGICCVSIFVLHIGAEQHSPVGVHLQLFHKTLTNKFVGIKENVLYLCIIINKPKNKQMKKTIEVVKTPFTMYRVSINGEETYDVLTQDPHDIGSAIMIRETESGDDVPYEKWEEIERMVNEWY